MIRALSIQFHLGRKCRFDVSDISKTERRTNERAEFRASQYKISRTNLRRAKNINVVSLSVAKWCPMVFPLLCEERGRRMESSFT